ncbi:hypothetical protein KSP39_PZI021190 [Platanthera zijinensis]|uniref:Uncharacterized protein n=1 Tax=Platanthera zijinensis TaxID=2320716 RepID=A0AAP0FWF9_9ASPA
MLGLSLLLCDVFLLLTIHFSLMGRCLGPFFLVTDCDKVIPSLHTCFLYVWSFLADFWSMPNEQVW